MNHVALKRTTLMLCPEDQAFHVCRGDVIRNVNDLARCISSLTDDEFHHHVGGDFDHFSDWIRVVLKNDALARDLLYDVNKSDKEHYVKTIEHHVAWLHTIHDPKPKAKKKAVKKAKKKAKK